MKNLKIQIVDKIHKELVLNCDKRHRLIVGGRGKGASWSIARIELSRGIERKRFIVCVREVQKTIKDSVYKLLRDTIQRCNLEWFYTVLSNSIRGKNGTEFVFYGLRDFNADNIKSLEGADDCWIAEAQAISRMSINILRPTIRKDGSVVWWDFNPRYETDPVYVDYILNKDPNAKVCYVNWKDNPWFTEALKMEKDSDYARNTEEAEHIWEGKLRNMGERYVCPSYLVDMAMRNRILIPKGLLWVGADIAHQGGDAIVFYKRYGYKIIEKYKSRYQDVPTTVRHLKSFIADRSIPCNIDNGHVGAAVADYLIKDKYIVNRINFGGTPIDTEHYEDSVTEMYFNLRDIFPFADIPMDDELRNQLVNRKYDFITGKRGYEVMKIESKKDFKKHAVMQSNSPDDADALALTYYYPGDGGAAETLNYNIYR